MDVPLEVTAVGHVDAYSNVAVRTRVGGEVTKVAFREGQDVKAGDPLFELDRRPYQAALSEAEANVERDRARAREADENLKRYAELVKKDYVTKEQFSQATSNAEALKATVKGDEAALEPARLNLAYCTIQSPISGRTGGLLVHPGNLVKANDDRALVVINQVEPIYVTFSVPEATLAEVKKRAAEGTLKVFGPPERPGRGSVRGPSHVHRQRGGRDNRDDQPAGRRSRTTTARSGPGSSRTSRSFSRRTAGATVAPNTAVQPGQSGSLVYVIKADDSVEARPVTVRRVWKQLVGHRKGTLPGRARRHGRTAPPRAGRESDDQEVMNRRAEPKARIAGTCGGRAARRGRR